MIAVWLALSQAASAADPAPGWALSSARGRGYTASIDTERAHHGAQSLLLRGSPRARDFATVVQKISPERYRGRRIRLWIWLRCEGVIDWSGAWVRIDGGHGDEALAFDNMQGRALAGTQPWTRHAIVLDVPTSATEISYGVLLAGAGALWADDVRLEVVGPEVPTTDLIVRDLVPSPTNLDFEP